MLDSMLKRKEYSNTGKYVFPGIAYDCSLNWYRRFLNMGVKTKCVKIEDSIKRVKPM